MFIDALYKDGLEIIKIVERVDGKRKFIEHRPDWHFYVKDKRGEHTTIYGDKVKKITPSNKGEKSRLTNQFFAKDMFESDSNPIMRCLEQNYLGCTAPKLHVAFFDIETDFDKVRGYSEPDEAFNPITSIAVYLQWLQSMVCLAVPPKGMTFGDAKAIAEEIGENIIICRTEGEMLNIFLDIVDDADILSGWNSELYDIPYTVNRIIRVLGKHESRRMCLWDELPKRRKFERMGKTYQTYDLVGKVHLDYMNLYKNYTYEQKHSYSLNSIAEEELGEQKVEYDGTLDQLYNQDFKKFLEYNIQDTMLLERLDQKLQYIDLVNVIAHEGCVLLPSTQGTVGITDQAITLEAHSKGLIVPDRRRHEGETRAAGGWVAKPKKGLHKWVGSADLTSLYPSVIRAFNISPETIVGQVRLSDTLEEISEWIKSAKTRTYGNWWNDRFHPLEMDAFFNRSISDKVTLDLETGESLNISGEELHQIVFDSGQRWCITANGTIFDMSKQGIVPSLMTRWFRERKIRQGIKKVYEKLDDNPNDGFSTKGLVDHKTYTYKGKMESPFFQDSVFSINEFNTLVESGDASGLEQYMQAKGLTVNENGFVMLHDMALLKEIVGFWDKRQMVSKISLNATYGCLLNEGSKFFDQRMGQSITLSGRNITKHMAAKTNELIVGKYDHYGESIIYGDTDSTYFSAWPALKAEVEAGEIEWGKNEAISVYDNISDQVSDTFPSFLKDSFNVPESFSVGVINSDREIVATSALFIKKKRYAAMVFDSEGKRLDVNGKPGKVKAMGLDLRRSDTPKFVQKFLMDILTDTLTGSSEEHVIEKIKEFKKEFKEMKPWEKGTPKGANKVTHYTKVLEEAFERKMKGQKSNVTIPGHIRAAINWNNMRRQYNDLHSPPIIDGAKTIVCKLSETANSKLASIAYPVDIKQLPDWFLSLPFNEEEMLEVVVTQKVDNLLGVLNWKLEEANEQHEHFSSFFGF